MPRVIRRMGMIDAGSNFALKIAAKPLEIATCLLLTNYKQSSSAHRPMQRYHRRSPKAYRLATIHALQIGRRQTARWTEPVQNCRTVYLALVDGPSSFGTIFSDASLFLLCGSCLFVSLSLSLVRKFKSVEKHSLCECTPGQK